MTRGRDRAPSQNAYRGAAGATRTRALHVTLPSGDVVTARVYDVIDAVADPELAQRLLSNEPINLVHGPDGAAVAIAVPVVYHDPSNELYVLVATEADRHRELELRGQLYADLARDPTAAVPAYVRGFSVVFGAAGLARHLEARADAALAERRAVDTAREVERERAGLEHRRAELVGRAEDLERRAGDLERQVAAVTQREIALDARAVDLDRREDDLERRRAELDIATADLARRQADAERELREAREAAARARDERPRAQRPTPGDVAIRAIAEAGRAHNERVRAAAEEPVTMPVRPLPETHDDVTSPYELLAEADAPELPASADPITTITAEAPRVAHDAWVAAFARGSAPSSFALEDGRARVAIRAPGPSAPALAASPLDVRVVLHRLPEYAVIALVIGTPAALRGLGPPHRVVIALDVAGEPDRRFLAQLERDFTIELDVVADHSASREQRPIRRARLKAPLGENVAFVVRAASDHLRGLPAASFARGLEALAGPGVDLLGASHPEHGEFRVDKLEPLTTANQVRRALAIARRFSKPAREDYLACVRGFPLPRWRELRQAVLVRAIELGLWMGAELAQAAVSEELARSRKDLVTRLEAAFASLLGDATRNDLDPDAIEDNRKALVDEARGLGVAVAGETETASSQAPAASGTIAPRPAAPASLRGRPAAELLALLDDRERRVSAALELCERGEPAAVRPVMNAVRRMSRSDAVRVLGAMVRLGPPAAPALTAGLASSKAFLRHGCALALALLRTEEGTEAVVDLLLSEPTEIWREIARAVGHVGPAALMPLAARLGRLGDKATAAERERIAWAMAHVGVRGGKTAVETLAGGHSAVAPVARMALERLEPAARDDLSGKQPVREVTVNRAFSRRFFEALERGSPELGKRELEALERSGPMELLDEADLVAEDEGEDAELDVSDLVDEDE